MLPLFYYNTQNMSELFPLWKLSCFTYLEFKHKSAKIALVVVSKSATTNAVKIFNYF